MDVPAGTFFTRRACCNSTSTARPRSILSPVRLHESQRAVVEHLDADAALVNGVMVEAAQRDEVGGPARVQISDARSSRARMAGCG